MNRLHVAAACLATLLLITGAVLAQDVLPSGTTETPAAPADASPSTEVPATTAETSDNVATPAGTEKLVEGAKETIDELAVDVDQNETAKEAAAGLLKHIYLVAEKLSFPAFHWLAFAIMVTGVVSYALQLVLAKLVVLANFSLSFREILSDSLGLVISVIGLVLTTQAAAENSSFTQSPFMVLSATVVGVVAGFIFYRWGQATEVEAVAGRRVATTPPGKR